ncbi:cytochrome c [Rhodoferax sp.]|jgi:cytochrome c553|uniref:c-type cytochrome n=1 Tax=Rhodoferax sp. TaxID=50421 RepID=UPI0027290855|nr:c-type cytochrome [Rhodoferax sp.]MDO9143851.1 c-type cytochrome [Rhodoferax sp.]MDP3192503.1 c-type cytochrome [Rhodoferax sp.]MDP3337146.1 c-type cytochrome [Rhodoferax sp.]MDP3866084.1 c-type cytochrome [Rhodoferax sp.]
MKLKKTLIASLLALAMGASWAQADQARAKKLVMGSCFLCHGENGESASEVFPKLAGQHAEYIAKQLDNFKTGKRKSTAMADMSGRLTADEMLALGQYFERKPVAPETVKDTDLAAVGRYIFHTGNTYSGVPSCASCHGKDGFGTANLPRLAGQYASYIETQLTLFNQRERTNDNAVMHAIVSKMTPLEMAAVAAYISGK